MKNRFGKYLFLLSLICLLNAQVEQTEQTGMINSKIRQYSEILSLEPQTIQSDCDQVNKYYQKSIEAYDFISTFTIEQMEETLQNLGKLRTLGTDLQQQAQQTFEQESLYSQLEDTRSQRRLNELQWRVNWSESAKSSEIPEEQVHEMKEEITELSQGKEKELQGMIEQKLGEQSKFLEEIQLSESSFNSLKSQKEDLEAGITVLRDKIEENQQKYGETIEGNKTSGERLKQLELQLNFFEEKKKQANTFESIKQLSQLSMKAQEDIEQLTNNITTANQTLLMLQESTLQLNDTLTTKLAQKQEIELQLETINTQLLQTKHSSEELQQQIEEAKQQQQAILLSQVEEKEFQKKQQSFLQLKFGDMGKELKRVEEKCFEGKKLVEKLEKEEVQIREGYLITENEIKHLTAKLALTKNNQDKSSLLTELKRLNTHYKSQLKEHSSKKSELLKQKNLLQTYESFKQQLQATTAPGKLSLALKKEGPHKKVAISQKGATKTKSGKSTSTSPAAPTIVTTTKKVVKKSVPVGSKAPIKEAYPVPGVKNQKGKGKSKNVITTTKITQQSLKDINVQAESERRGKSVNGIEELILQYEELITIKENYLEQQLKIVIEKEEKVIKRENEIKAAQQQIKQAVIKCKKEKKSILQKAKEERESAKYKKAEAEAKRNLDKLTKQLKQELQKEQEISKQKKKMEDQEKKLQEKQAELDKLVEEIEKKIFENAATKQKKAQLIEMAAEETHNIPLPSFEDQPTLIEKDQVVTEVNKQQEPQLIKEQPELAKEEIKINEQQKNAEQLKSIIKEKQNAIKEDEKTIEQKELELDQKEQQLQQKQVEVQKDIEQLNENINKCKLIFNTGDKQSQEYQVCEWQSKDYEQKSKQLQQLKSDYIKELSEFKQQKEEFYSKQANSLMYSFSEVNLEISHHQQQQKLQANKVLQKHFNNLDEFYNENEKSLSKSIRHGDGMVYLLQNAGKLSGDLKTVLLSISDNHHDEVKQTLQQVLDEITKLYETAIVQRNLKQGQNVLLEKKKVLMKLQSACLEAQKILQQEQQQQQ